MIHKNLYIFMVCFIFHQLFAGELPREALLHSPSYFLQELELERLRETSPIADVQMSDEESPLEAFLNDSSAEFFSTLARAFNEQSSPPVKRLAKLILEHTSSKPNDNCLDDPEEYPPLATIGEEGEHRHNPHCQICKS